MYYLRLLMTEVAWTKDELREALDGKRPPPPPLYPGQVLCSLPPEVRLQLFGYWLLFGYRPTCGSEIMLGQTELCFKCNIGLSQCFLFLLRIYSSEDELIRECKMEHWEYDRLSKM